MDKAPSLGIPFFFRVVLPGAVVSAALSPLALVLLDVFQLTTEQKTAAVAGLLVLAGVVLWAMDDPIYGFLEGRWWWPARLKRARVKAWKNRVAKLYARAQDPNDVEYNERWASLRKFPVDAQRKPTATAPTRFGNILAAYENYPSLRYGMDSVFFWPRIWLQLEKDTRSEIDEAWAIADSFTYLVAGLLFAALIYVGALLWSLLPDWAMSPFRQHEPWRLLAAAFGLLLLARVAYLVSLPLHARNGEVFKSLFDLFRDKVSDLGPATDDEKARFDEIYQALQYGDTFNHKAKPAPLSIPPDAEFGVVFKKP
jgi:hypothetical protein